MIHSDMRSVMQIASTVVSSKPNCRMVPGISAAVWSPSSRRPSLPRLTAKVRAFSTDGTGTNLPPAEKVADKPPVCTADELHYVSVANSDWRLALWRYNPPPQAPPRNHPLLLLSGLGTNAIGYDLSHGSSFARYMCAQGFDTWILEVRGAGLSMQRSDLKGIEQSAHAISDQIEYVADAATDIPFNSREQKTNTSRALEESDISVIKDLEGTNTSRALEESDISVIKDLEGIEKVNDNSILVTKLTETLLRLSGGVSGFLSEGQVKIMSANFFDQMSRLLEDSFLFERFIEIRKRISSLLEERQNSVVASQIRDLSQKLVNIFEESQRSVSPQLSNLQERVNATLEDFQKQLDLIVMYDWDFDHYLLEDLPAAMEYIRALAKPGDGKLLAVGHSMGGILLYAMLSRCAFEGKDPGLAAIVTLASSLDYRSSDSSLKQLLPLADPAQALNVPIVPLGALLAAAYPLSSRPPYVLSWLNDLISSEDMMHPELLRKLVMNNFCTVPAKLILQLRTAFMEGGLSDRTGNFLYKDYLHKSEVPVLAIAGDRDIICPPIAVHETAKLFPEHLVTYKIFGEPEGPHYAHYDLVGGRLAVDEVYPCIIQFLAQYD